MMKKKGMLAALALIGLVASNAAPAAAHVRGGPGDEAGNQIVIANHSVTPVRVYVEGPDGAQYDLGRVERGETKMFAAPARVAQRGGFRVGVRPSGYTQLFRDPVGIATHALTVDEDDTVILWLERHLSQSKVEFRDG